MLFYFKARVVCGRRLEARINFGGQSRVLEEGKNTHDKQKIFFTHHNTFDGG